MAKNVTIYTDASYCSETFATGWAAWIKFGPETALRVSGTTKKPMPSANAAELAAIAYALTRASKVIDEGDLVVVVTDSETARFTLTNKRKNISDAEKEILTYIVQLCERLCCRLKVNKVKGHSRSDGTRSSVNRMVDKMAKEQMRLARKKGDFS